MTFSSIAEKTFSVCSAGIGQRCAVWLLCGASVCCASAMHASSAFPTGSHSGVSAKAVPATRKYSTTARKRPADASQKTTATPPIPANAEAQPATVSLKNGKLTIEAHNSDLAQILREVTKISGMTIEGLGLSKSARVFGAYGPGNPQEVLTHLLIGSGYNFLMAGDTANGVPRELLLITQSNSASAAAPASPHPDVSGTAPSVATQDSQDSQDSSDREQRMQQVMQRLQEMHEQQNAPQ